MNSTTDYHAVPDATRAPEIAPAWPLVSVALATYNGVRYLEQLLRSIEDQDYASIEIVVSDDGSSDGTRRLLEERIWRRPHRMILGTSRAGVVGNFSRALGACEGRYIALSDQDDYWLPVKISALVARLRTIEVAGEACAPAVVFSDIEVVDAELRTLAPSFFGVNYSASNCRTFADFLLTNHVPGCAMLLNRELLNTASPIPSDFHMHDWWLMATAAAFGRIDFVDRPLMQYRQHGANVIGAAAHRTRWSTKMTKVLRPSAWRDWFRFIRPSDVAVETTVRNVARLEERYGGCLPDAAARSVALLHACRHNPVAALRFVLDARTGERKLYSAALLNLAARRLRVSASGIVPERSAATPSDPVDRTRKECK